MPAVIQPTHPLLKQCIDFFYFSPAANGPVSYVAFPNVKTCLSFFRNGTISVQGNDIHIQPSPGSNEAMITGLYTQPAYVQYTTTIAEIAIVLKPLGLHYLLPNAANYTGNVCGIPFHEPDWWPAIHTAFNANDMKAATMALEAFLQTQLRTPSLQNIAAAIQLLKDTDDTVAHIASLLHIHKKTLERQFTAAVGCPPATYRRILRFRRSVDVRLLNQQVANLTDVAHTSRYYDQSYFIREYRKLTGNNPGDFFARVTAFERNKLVWVLR
jgi:AraC-like DNA-binding protein